MKTSILVAGLLGIAASSAQAFPVSLQEQITHVKSPYESQTQTIDLVANHVDTNIFKGANESKSSQPEHAEFARFTLIDESYTRLSPVQSKSEMMQDLRASVTQKKILGQ